MRVTNRAGQRVGGVGRWYAGEAQQTAHHFLHLGFGGAALANDRLLVFTGSSLIIDPVKNTQRIVVMVASKLSSA